MKGITKKQYKKGTIIEHKKKRYVVQCSISMQWLHKKTGFITFFKEIK